MYPVKIHVTYKSDKKYSQKVQNLFEDPLCNVLNSLYDTITFLRYCKRIFICENTLSLSKL